MSKCVFAGCFDPFTNGHLDVIKRLSEAFDEVYVVVSKNVEKKLVLDGEQRFNLVKKSINLPNVQVFLHEGLLVDFCKNHQVNCIVKGIRNIFDYDYETLQAKVNKEIGEIETLFLPCAAQYAFVSSSFVREMFSLKREVRDYIPSEIYDEVKKAYSPKN